MTKLILSAAVAGAIAFGATSSVMALPTVYPLVKLSISGTVYYTPNYDNELSQEVPLKKVSYSTSSLIALLNNSPYASNYVFIATGKTNIPSGSYFLWNPWDDSLLITNKNGFSFPMEGEGYDFGYLYVDYDNLIGTYKLASDYSGSETDKTGTYFYFYDGANFEDYIEVYGTATLNWSYGKYSGILQTVTLSTSMGGASEDGGETYGYENGGTTFSASGSGTVHGAPIAQVPFFWYY